MRRIITVGFLTVGLLIAPQVLAEPVTFNMWICKAECSDQTYYGYSKLFRAQSGQGRSAQEFARLEAVNQCYYYTGYDDQDAYCQVFSFTY
jgi:hypothetical protein